MKCKPLVKSGGFRDTFLVIIYQNRWLFYSLEKFTHGHWKGSFTVFLNSQTARMFLICFSNKSSSQFFIVGDQEGPGSKKWDSQATT